MSIFLQSNAKIMRRNYNVDAPECFSCNYQDNDLLCVLQHPELQKVSENKTYNFYKKGQLIFFEGNRPQGLYCIHQGKVKIHKLGDDGKEQIVRLAKKGSMLGYRSLLSSEPYTASATALEDCKICFISKSTIMDLVNDESKFSMQAIKVLTNDLKSAENKMMNMAQKPVTCRVADALLTMVECYGLCNDRETINSILTRRDISCVAGTTTETTIRVLSDFNKRSVVKLNGKRIIIPDMNRLKRVADNMI